VTHQSSVELASRQQAATKLNDSNAVSCTVPVFAGNEAVLCSEIQERTMTGIPGEREPGNAFPTSVVQLVCLSDDVGLPCVVPYYAFLSNGEMFAVSEKCYFCKSYFTSIS